MSIAKINGVKVQREEILRDIKQIEEHAENCHLEVGVEENDLSSSLVENETMPNSSPSLNSDLPIVEKSKVLEPKNLIVLQAMPTPQRSPFYLVIIALSLHSMALQVLFFGLAMSIDSTGFESVQVNAILLGVSSMAGYYFAVHLESFPRIKSITIIYSSIILSTVVNYLLTVYAPKIVIVQIIRSLLSMVVINGLLCFAFCNYYLYAGEALDVSRRGMGIGISSCFGKLAGSSSTFIKTYCINHGIDPVIGFTIPVIFAIIALQLVRETNPRRL